MTQALRLLFDDCLSKHAVQALKTLTDFSDGAVQVTHLVDLSLSGELDDDWIPRIATEGWIVVTTDRGRKNRGGKLPLICRRCNVTHVMLSAAIHKRNTFEKLRAIFDVWPSLLTASAGTRGAGYLLQATGAHGVKLICIHEPEGKPASRTQLDLELRSD